MTERRAAGFTVPLMSPATRALVRLAAIVAVGDETALRVALAQAIGPPKVDPLWVEELILQSYLFAGFPRALNAAREWRRISGRSAPDDDEGVHLEHVGEWERRGIETCAVVYGPFYHRLRPNIRALHPALDAWMIVEGYGKVLSRPGLDLARRELCIVAVCAAAGQDRQLHSHLHGALHAGAAPSDIEDTLAAIGDLLEDEAAARYGQLWLKVLGHRAGTAGEN